MPATSTAPRAATIHSATGTGRLAASADGQPRSSRHKDQPRCANAHRISRAAAAPRAAGKPSTTVSIKSSAKARPSARPNVHST